MNGKEEKKRHYTTELSKGQGAITETLTLLTYWEPGREAEELTEQVLEEGALGRASFVRAKDLVQRVFVRRYLADGGTPACVLKTLRAGSADLSVLKQLMLVYTARQHDILHDFITTVYWPKYEAGATHIARRDAEDFIRQAEAMGTIEPRWSDTMVVKVARYLVGTLADFGLLEEGRATSKRIVPFHLTIEVVVILAYELHFAGYSDTGILENPDWRLFGLTREDVVEQLRRASYDGHFIVQYAGDLLRISWEYDTMGECLHAIA